MARLEPDCYLQWCWDTFSIPPDYTLVIIHLDCTLVLIPLSRLHFGAKADLATQQGTRKASPLCSDDQDQYRVFSLPQSATMGSLFSAEFVAMPHSFYLGNGRLV